MKKQKELTSGVDATKIQPRLPFDIYQYATHVKEGMLRKYGRGSLTETRDDIYVGLIREGVALFNEGKRFSYVEKIYKTGGRFATEAKLLLDTDLYTSIHAVILSLQTEIKEGHVPIVPETHKYVDAMCVCVYLMRLAISNKKTKPAKRAASNAAEYLDAL